MNGLPSSPSKNRAFLLGIVRLMAAAVCFYAFLLAANQNTASFRNRAQSYVLEPPPPAHGFDESALDRNGLFAAGDGSIAAPYIIATAQQLDNVRYYPDCWYVLNNDIDLSTYQTFSPIGYGIFKWGAWNTEKAFTGQFDANNKLIYGLDMRTDTLCSGLFGAIGAGGCVKNLRLECAVSCTQDQANNAIGAIAGYNAGRIENCTVTANIFGSGSYIMAGGIVGANNGTISQCDSKGYISANGKYAKAGGIAGLVLQDGAIIAGKNYAMVTCAYSAGGIASWNEGAIRYSQNYASISGGVTSGGIVATAKSSMEGCYNLSFAQAARTG